MTGTRQCGKTQKPRERGRVPPRSRHWSGKCGESTSSPVPNVGVMEWYSGGAESENGVQVVQLGAGHRAIDT
jgi:hypothetical protein